MMANELKKGTFIKWTAKDQQGSFSHVGQIFSIKDGHVVMATSNGGAMGFELTDGTVEVTRKPKTWGIVKSCDTEVEVPKPVMAIARTSNSNSGGKLEQVIALLRATPVTSRKDAIEKIVAAGISTPAGASTYYNTAKNMM